MDKSATFTFTFIFVLISIGKAKSNKDFEKNLHTICSRKCPFQNKTEDHLDIGCGGECKTGQCSKGCLLWRKALESNCQTVCNGTQNMISQKELHCIMGCNDAISRYIQNLKDEIGTPPAPYLVADTLTATSLSLAWEGTKYSEISYLVQWRYEEHAGAWQYCKNQSWGPSNIVLVEHLQPFTKYRFRVVLLLSPHNEFIISEPSVVISTLPGGVPSSPPIITRTTAVDSKRISISWKPGPFPNGPIHSYILELLGEYTALKEDIPATNPTDFYMFQNLNANSKYIISVSMRNAFGEGPPATVEISTPPEPLVKDTPQTTLILVTQRRIIKQRADMMMDVPRVIYESSSSITGIAIHINKELIFVSDSDGYVSVANLHGYIEPKYLLTPFDITFHPLDLSVDWLNQHIYILGEVSHNNANFWQIARCSLSGTSLTVAVAGITSKPLKIEVDPYNGYLFWVIQGINRGGLYRLDLANISNGIKHEVIPDVILENPYLGAFIVDHINFCLLVPNHAKNTVYSVSLDGRDVVDIRTNTQQPLFQNVISLAIANGLFYWTNGQEVLAEDYHEDYHTYFHNHYLGSKSSSYIGVYVDLPTTQPTPVPVNPPIKVQAVLGVHVAKTSWHPPHMVGGQGKGAWQNWFYELQVKNEITGEIITKKNIRNTTFYTVEGLESDTKYLIKAAAYTTSGNGPWSSEFIGKTLKTSEKGQYPTILWSTTEGLLESDVTGEEVEVLLSRENLKEISSDYHFTDICSYHDMLYLVANTTAVYWYNLTNHDYGRLHNLEAVGSIAVDWMGKKLYWSNPKQQLIMRGDLYGLLPEPLLILTIAKELNIDSEYAFIYWSTGHAVECARLNGDDRRIYYPAELFSGKQVMGLTLNMDDRNVYWIVRSNEGSHLYKAAMADSSEISKHNPEAVKVSSLQYPTMQGPLCYFSDHFLWLQDNRKAVIADLAGQNAAVVNGISLSGLYMISIMDRNLKKTQSDKVYVIPEAINASSISIKGTSFSFNITWNPVTNVNFGQVFYDVKTEAKGKEMIVKVKENFLIYDMAKELPPYSELKVTIQAFTYWGSSLQVMKTIYSPPSLPGKPMNARVFVTHTKNLTGEINVATILRWDPPEHPNGQIISYKVKYFFRGAEGEKFFYFYSEPNHLELILRNLSENFTYFFQIKAFTLAGEGEYTEPIWANTSSNAEVPTLLITTKDSIILLDYDTKYEKVISIVDQPKDITFNSHEGWIYWLNDMNEIYGMKIDGSKKYKIHVLNGTGLSLTIDWIGRFLYWSEIDDKDFESSRSSIYRLDLTVIESGIFEIDKIVTRVNKIREIEVSPFMNKLYWIEETDDGKGYLMQSKTNGLALSSLFTSVHMKRQCNCSENQVVGKILTLNQIDPNNIIIAYGDEKPDRLFATDSEGCECKQVIRSSKLPPTAITSDYNYFYWSNETENSLFILNDKSKIQTYEILGIKTIIAIGQSLQPLPPFICLNPLQNASAPSLIFSTSTSITLKLPVPQRHSECENISSPSIKYIVYFDLFAEEEISQCYVNISKCKSVITFHQTLKIKNLEPFSKYVFRVSLQIHLSSFEKYLMSPSAVFATLAGAPSSPQNVSTIAITPSAVEVKWVKSIHSIHQDITYEVHWQTEGTVGGIRQSGEQLVEKSEIVNDFNFSITIKKLIPGQLYLIWVRAFSKDSSMFSESKKVEVMTLSQPDNITLIHAEPYSLEITWTPPYDLAKSFNIQFRHFSGLGKWKIVEKMKAHNTNTYFIEDLSPKTYYGFRTAINYTKSNETYFWPPDGEFVFETLGGRPSRPGTPIIQLLRKDVYQVLWEKPLDNGAAIDHYILEGLITKTSPKKRETNETESIRNAYKNVSDSILQWIQYYNGTENYWIINKLSPSLRYLFRVKAKNKFGWSDFSEMSKSFDFTETFILKEQEELSLILSTALPVFLLCCVILIIIFCCVTKIHDNEKKDLQILNLGTENRILRQPDVELATLRELPRRGNFIQNSNVLYATSEGSPTDEEVALLPHIPREQFKLTKFLGSGAFGEVYEGVAQGISLAGSETRVAIKALRKGATEQEKGEFLKEAQLMSHFKHEHILKLLGVCLDNDPNYILMELMEGGDLLSYLRMNRPLINASSFVKLQDLINISIDVTKGCRYLEEMHFVHRDLACRNCLVSSTNPMLRVVKIGDFGLARDIYKNDYYRKEGEGLLPVRWMSPESLIDGVFTSQSDVWAFGVLIWEIMTLGQQPYPARTNLEVLHYVRSGGRLGRPKDCPEELYQLMEKCWNFNPENRPTFKHCLEALTSLKERLENVSLIVHNNLDSAIETKLDTENNEESNNFEDEVVEKNHDADDEDLRKKNLTIQTNHEYLQLLHDEEEEQGSDAYEIPKFLSNFSHPNRTFHTSSNASDFTKSTNLNSNVSPSSYLETKSFKYQTRENYTFNS